MPGFKYLFCFDILILNLPGPLLLEISLKQSFQCPGMSAFIPGGLIKCCLGRLTSILLCQHRRVSLALVCHAFPCQHLSMFSFVLVETFPFNSANLAACHASSIAIDLKDAATSGYPSRSACFDMARYNPTTDEYHLQYGIHHPYKSNTVLIVCAKSVGLYGFEIYDFALDNIPFRESSWLCPEDMITFTSGSIFNISTRTV